MTSAAATQPAATDWRVIVSGGVKLGVVTAIGVAVFALMSRAIDGTAEFVLQSVLVLLGAALASFLPPLFFRPRDVDTTAWAAMIGLLGSLTFTVIDTALFRPLHLYHWTWDAIGGGSGFWYIPVWWMGATFLAWLGSWVVANRGGDVGIASSIGLTVGMAIVVAAILTLVGVPLHAASVALAYTVALILHVPLSAMMHRG
jgi:hypothetical protein